MKEKLVEKLFRDSCSREELDLLLDLIRKDPAPPSSRLLRKLFEEADRQPAPSSDIKSKIFSQVTDKIRVSKPKADEPVLAKFKVFIPWSIAATFALTLGLAIWIFSGRTAEQVVTTDFGQKHALELSDGSKVQLNANSQLIYDKNWSYDEDRAVWLKGEAFFEVKKRPTNDQKFQVITKDLVIEVLGTSFNVNCYGDKTKVYLEEGSIRLFIKHLDTTLMMQAGDLIVYSESSQEIERKNGVSTEYHTSWRDGVLTFWNAPLRQVLDKIEETYGVNFIVADESLYERLINYSLPIDELETAMSILEKTVEGLEVRHDSNVIYLE
ncbi:MAG: anti-sigma factor [Saprospiraceae bacterium]|nr:anti-sigma factor [Saprospiraceae bacterium]